MQYEALYVRKRGKRFGLFFIHENSSTDSREAERREPRDFQVSWADWVVAMAGSSAGARRALSSAWLSTIEPGEKLTCNAAIDLRRVCRRIPRRGCHKSRAYRQVARFRVRKHFGRPGTLSVYPIS